jgi:hypothetical protein
MDKQQRDEERRAYLKENADTIMTELILQIVTVRPANVVEFIHEWSGKKLSGEVIAKVKVTDEVRRSMPKLVYPEEVRGSARDVDGDAETLKPERKSVGPTQPKRDSTIATPGPVDAKKESVRSVKQSVEQKRDSIRSAQVPAQEKMESVRSVQPPVQPPAEQKRDSIRSAQVPGEQKMGSIRTTEPPV